MRAESYVLTYKGTVRACYFDTRRIGRSLFEIIWKSWLMESWFTAGEFILGVQSLEELIPGEEANQ